MFTHVTNTETSSFRIESLDGRPCLVGPCVMLGEGTWSGSSGPITYTNEVLQNSVSEWNHRPVLVNHPDSGSGCDVPTINASKIGSVQNTIIIDGKLKGELYITLSRCKDLAPDILRTIESGGMLEVSTGLYGRVDNSGNILDIQPDHLAILPTDKGAMSIESGAGFPRWNKKLKVGMNDVYTMLFKSPEIRSFAGESGVYIEDIGSDWFVFSAFNEDDEEMYQGKYSLDGASVKVDISSFKKVEKITEYIPKPEEKEDEVTMVNQMKETPMDEVKPEVATAPVSVVLNSLEEVFTSETIAESVKNGIRTALDFQKQEHGSLVQNVLSHELNVLNETILNSLSIAELRDMKTKLDEKKPTSTATYNMQSAPAPASSEPEIVKPLFTNAWK